MRHAPTHHAPAPPGGVPRGSLLAAKGERARTGAAVYDVALGKMITVDTRALPPTINAAELAGIAAALRAGYTTVATDSLTSLQQIAIRRPAKLARLPHRYRSMLEEIVALIAAAPGCVLLLKVRAHKGILGNEGADGGAVWAAQATAGHDVTATEPRDALTGLAAVSEVQADGSYRPIQNIGPALKKMVQARHRMGAAKHSDYHTYYQALQSPKPVAEGDPDDPGDRAVQGPLAWLMRGSKTREATVLMQIRTGNAYNQKHAHRWGWCPDDRCPLCGMASDAPYVPRPISIR
jgi:hypothetical protein